MPNQNRYFYWQPFPYIAKYWAFMTLGTYLGGLKNKLAIVRRINSHKWEATNETDPTFVAHGKTRDAAVDALLEMTGGIG